MAFDRGAQEFSLQPAFMALAESSRGAGGLIDQKEFTRRLLDVAAADYRRGLPSAQLVEFPHGPAIYLFDIGDGGPGAGRTVLAVAQPEPPASARDAAYQRGYPAPDKLSGRPVDRGHFVPYTAGGLFGPNLFVQDRALNRGWSSDGRDYRALELTAVAGAPASLMFVRPVYADHSAIPEFLDLGVIAGPELTGRRFRNRFDTISRSDPNLLAVHLRGATNAQIGSLGEETAAAVLESAFDAIIVAMGDTSLPRDENRQDLDLLAIVDDTLIVYEVKARHLSKAAGRRTRNGDLHRPRLSRPRTPTGSRQGSQAYVAARLAAHIDTGQGYEGVDVRVMAVDFQAMLAQQFAVNRAGTRLNPLGPPIDCAAAALQALTRILDHRGYL